MGWCSDDALHRPPLQRTRCCVTNGRASTVPTPCKSILENARTRCKAPILIISARGEVPMTSACSDTIRQLCQSEKRSRWLFQGNMIGDEQARQRDTPARSHRSGPGLVHTVARHARSERVKALLDDLAKLHWL